MLKVCEHRSLESAAALRGDWQRLLAETPEADYFHTFDWLETYWRHYGEGQQLRVLQLLDGDQTVGIVPLVVRQESTKAGTLRVLTHPLDDWGSFYGPIGRDRVALLAAAMRHARADRSDWDVIDLRWVRADEDSEGWLLEAMRAARLPVYRRPRSVIPVARLEEGWESYWACRSRRTRANLNNYERKTQRLGQVEYVRFRPEPDADADPRWDLYDACERVAAMSWQGSSTSGTTLTHEAVRAFLRDQHEAAVRAGGVDLNLLRIDGRDVAFQYNYRHGGRVSGLRLGFDPDCSKSGVGKVLMLMSIRDSCERGDRLYDFLPGHLEAKRRFATDFLDCHSFFHGPMRLGRALPMLGKRIYDHWQTSRGVALPASVPGAFASV